MSSYEKALPEIINSLKSTYGPDFFNVLTLQLNKHIGADYTMICRLDEKSYTSKTISLVAKGKLIDNFEYSLINTPCAEVNNDSLCIYPSGICHLYPNDQLLVDMKIEGYIGTPLHDSKGSVIGLVVALHEQEITNPDYVVTLFELFSGRISAEIERTEHEQALQALTLSLEHQVASRTKALSTALEQLQQSQAEVIAKEKMASLGLLVAGVAHEINSPLGVAILGSSMLDEISTSLQQKLSKQTLSKHELEDGLRDMLASVQAVSFNLQRAASLVENFKQVAVDRSSDEIKSFTVSTWLTSLMNSFHPMLKKHNIHLDLQFPETPITLASCTSKLAQVITNLVSNTVIHGFPSDVEIVDKQIVMTILDKTATIELIIADNGVGITSQVMPHLFEPFYTTNRHHGSTGLGLSIIRNILTESLEGNIDVNQKKHAGSEFVITLPKVLRQQQQVKT